MRYENYSSGWGWGCLLMFIGTALLWSLVILVIFLLKSISRTLIQ